MMYSEGTIRTIWNRIDIGGVGGTDMNSKREKYYFLGSKEGSTKCLASYI